MAMPGLQRAMEAKVIKKQLHLSYKKKSPAEIFSPQDFRVVKNNRSTKTGK